MTDKWWMIGDEAVQEVRQALLKAEKDALRDCCSVPPRVYTDAIYMLDTWLRPMVRDKHVLSPANGVIVKRKTDDTN